MLKKKVRIKHQSTKLSGKNKPWIHIKHHAFFLVNVYKKKTGNAHNKLLIVVNSGRVISCCISLRCLSFLHQACILLMGEESNRRGLPREGVNTEKCKMWAPGSGSRPRTQLLGSPGFPFHSSQWGFVLAWNCQLGAGPPQSSLGGCASQVGEVRISTRLRLAPRSFLLLEKFSFPSSAWGISWRQELGQSLWLESSGDSPPAPLTQVSGKAK